MPSNKYCRDSNSVVTSGAVAWIHGSIRHVEPCRAVSVRSSRCYYNSAEGVSERYALAEIRPAKLRFPLPSDARSSAGFPHTPPADRHASSATAGSSHRLSSTIVAIAWSLGAPADRDTPDSAGASLDAPACSLSSSIPRPALHSPLPAAAPARPALCGTEAQTADQ